MKRFMLTLWEMLAREREPAPPVVPVAPRRSGPMQQRYDALVRDMKTHWGIRVHRWRGRTSGCAWELRDRTGHVDRLIEAPYPRGPMSCAVFLHEVGHHAIGFNRYSPRCLEEYMAWEWSLKTMEDRGFNVTAAVRKRRDEALTYAVAKAVRRGLKRIPEPLIPYVPAGISVVSTPRRPRTSPGEPETPRSSSRR